MNGILFIFIMLALAAVVGTLAIGLYHMTRGGEEHREKSKKWMQIRVLVQGVAIALLALAMLMGAGK